MCIYVCTYDHVGHLHAGDKTHVTHKSMSRVTRGGMGHFTNAITRTPHNPVDLHVCANLYNLNITNSVRSPAAPGPTTPTRDESSHKWMNGPCHIDRCASDLRNTWKHMKAPKTFWAIANCSRQKHSGCRHDTKKEKHMCKGIRPSQDI